MVFFTAPDEINVQGLLQVFRRQYFEPGTPDQFDDFYIVNALSDVAIQIAFHHEFERIDNPYLKIFIERKIIALRNEMERQRGDAVDAAEASNDWKKVSAAASLGFLSGSAAAFYAGATKIGMDLATTGGVGTMISIGAIGLRLAMQRSCRSAEQNVALLEKVLAEIAKGRRSEERRA